MKIGDYVNYTPITKITYLNDDINKYSGYTNTQTLRQTEGIKWRILELDETGTKPKTLISASATNEFLTLKGADGYNNAVYLINKACNTLYSKAGVGEARSITIEDLEKYYSEAGINARNAYTEAIMYGETRRFTTPYARYPQIATEENNMGIDTTLENEKNILKTNGINGSEQGKDDSGNYKTYTGSGIASTNGITVMQTYYCFNSSTMSSSYYKENVYYDLLHGSEIQRILVSFSLCYYLFKL